MSTALETPPEPQSTPPSQGDAGVTDEVRELQPLPLAIRVLLYFIGSLLIVVGLVGLVLPGLQGILTLALGLAVLSLTSEAANRVLHSMLGRWPTGLERYHQLRQKMHGWLSRG